MKTNKMDHPEHISQIMLEVECELNRATHKFGNFASHHEGYAILKEEVDELWDAVKANDHQHAREEAVQVAAMAIRFLRDLT